MVKLRRVGVFSLAKLQGIIMAIFGLIFGIFYAIIGVTVGSALGATGLLAGLGFLAIIILPIVYGIFGFIGGAVGALIYNLAAKMTGGIEMSFEQRN
jgi:hypothetical protein